jgi:hypothetical protein
MVATINTTDTEYKRQPVIYSGDWTDLDNYEDGDHALLSDMAGWLLAARQYGISRTAIMETEMTADSLSTTLAKTQFSAEKLAHMKRLLAQMNEEIDEKLEHYDNVSRRAESIVRSIGQ